MEKGKLTIVENLKIFEKCCTRVIQICLYRVCRCNSSLILVRSYYSCSVICKNRIQLSPFPSKINLLVRVRILLLQNTFYSLFLDLALDQASVMLLLSLGETWMQKQPSEVFCKKKVLRNFAKFTGKHLCQSLIFNKK